MTGMATIQDEGMRLWRLIGVRILTRRQAALAIAVRQLSVETAYRRIGIRAYEIHL